MCDQILFSHNKTTDFVLIFSRERIDVDKLAGAERVK